MDKSNVLYGKRVWEEHGKVSTVLTPLEKIVVEQWVEKELQRRWKIQCVYAGVMVMVPRGHFYRAVKTMDSNKIEYPFRHEDLKTNGWKRITGITINKLEFDK